MSSNSDLRVAIWQTASWGLMGFCRQPSGGPLGFALCGAGYRDRALIVGELRQIERELASARMQSQLLGSFWFPGAAEIRIVTLEHATALGMLRHGQATTPAL